MIESFPPAAGASSSGSPVRSDLTTGSLTAAPVGSPRRVSAGAVSFTRGRYAPVQSGGSPG